jgi:hypothetical protein
MLLCSSLPPTGYNHSSTELLRSTGRHWRSSLELLCSAGYCCRSSFPQHVVVIFRKAAARISMEIITEGYMISQVQDYE